jgi:chemotaxis protein methyltransferase CheR
MSASEEEACAYVIELVRQRSGIRLHHGKNALIQARLGKRIRGLGLAGLPQYCAFLRSEADEGEFTFVVEALTTNFTSFLREESHFRFLVDKALPRLLRSGEKRIHIWSAASSTGEEPYSIAFYLAEHFSPIAGWDWRITASDIAEKVLERARLGIYPEERLSGLPREWLRRYFQRGAGFWTGNYRIKPAIAERVAFQQINLIGDYTHPQPFHAVLCRNVLIYFDRPTQERMLRHLCRFVATGGFVMVGHSESLNGLNLPLRCLEPSVYQRV